MLEPACAPSSNDPSGFSVSSDDLSGSVGFWVPFRSGNPQLSCRYWEVLAVFPVLATVGLDLCRSVLEILRHPLRSSLKGVPWLNRSTSGCSSDFTSLPPMHRACSALLLQLLFSVFVTLIQKDKDLL
ncbi:hypothetical protein SLEP1_g10496 [Rubroshorea leprosula]|uniref:Uncharacterized protein n=1 Tax=Rubroshorea leprosula TaxID=152421 RepID=A0AAV5II65_9ROSI|nr:hypothetical protein SLEP1_g10496 [Rubroshorea leprosula]